MRQKTAHKERYLHNNNYDYYGQRCCILIVVGELSCNANGHTSGIINSPRVILNIL